MSHPILTQMSTKEFLAYCVPTKDNWTATLLSGIGVLWPEKLIGFDDDHDFDFHEVLTMVREEGINL